MTDTNALFGLELKTHPGSYWAYNEYSHTLDSATAKFAVVFQVPGACNLTGATVRVQGRASAPKYKMTLQGVNPAGDPDGSVLATTAGWTAEYRTNHEEAFTSPYTATMGKVLALVVEYDSGTIGASNDAQFRPRGIYRRYQNFPFFTHTADGSTWTPDDDEFPLISVQTNQDWDCGGIYAMQMGDEYADADAVGERYTQKMLIPDGEDIEFHVTGFNFLGRVMADTSSPSSGPCKAGIWTADGTCLASITRDEDAVSSFPSAEHTTTMFTFTSAATCTDGVPYYLGFECLDVAAALNVGYVDLEIENALRSWPGQDAFHVAAFAADGTTITEDKTKRLCLNPIISAIHGVAEAEECPAGVTGKGSLGDRSPSRVRNSKKSGYKLNARKTIKRDGGTYGWSPY